MGKQAAEHGVQHGSRHKFVVGRKRSLCFTECFSEYFHLENFTIRQIFPPPMCSCNEFAKFSRCQSFPPYSSKQTQMMGS